MRLLIWISILLVLKLISGCEYRIFSSEIVTKNSEISVDLAYQYKNGLTLQIKRGATVLQSVITSDNFSALVEPKTDTNGLTYSGYGKQVSVSLEVDTADYTEFKVVREMIRGENARDCLVFETSTHWYGGPQMKNSQYWPIEKQNFTNEAYVTKEWESMAVTERYWLNSKGVFFYVKPEVPLFISQRPDDVLCFIAKKENPYNTESRTFTFEYRIGVAKDPREAHLQAVTRYLGKPAGIPDQTMVQYPIWSTWALYKTEINEAIVRAMATKIKEKGFKNSQFEIDDKWEQCYGSLTIDLERFPNMLELTNWLKAEGYRVTLWIHPFINIDCDPWYTEALTKGFFVKNSTGAVRTKWWNSLGENEWASYIDFTNPEAAAWFVERLNTLKAAGGFDSFKFDAGESSWAPADPILQGDKALHPGKLTTDYINTVKQFGPIVEVRSGQQNQNMEIFMRMIDKDTYWGFNNGLASLITTLMQLNMNGYPFVLPDMIGGNGYNSKVTKELFIRWLQANVFMPSLQYSYVPWDYDPEDGSSTETVDLSKTFNALHEQYAPDIKTAMEKAVSDGYPVNPPIWWIAPTDQKALGIGDEFLLGEKIIAAPVITQGATSRRVYLPAGKWKDGNSETVYTGPTEFTYQAPLQTLPYFIKQED
uniref:CSON001239 protein n=1 Tax=Culicoides sonorensis TaxID=179676 RepID=A0A336LUM5_CULSO